MPDKCIVDIVPAFELRITNSLLKNFLLRIILLFLEIFRRLLNSHEYKDSILFYEL